MASPKALATQAIRDLEAASDLRVAAQSRIYYKPDEVVCFYGVSTPNTRKIAKNLSRQIRDNWQLDDALRFCDILIKRRELEAKCVGIFGLAEFRRSFDKTMLAKIEVWLEQGYCSDWSTTDGLCIYVIAPLIGDFPELIPKLKGWVGKKNLWLRRAAAVSLTPSARHGKHLDEVYEIAAKLLSYPEDLIRKANGWLLREAGKTDAKRLEAFLLHYGPAIPRTTLRYAIERFTPGKRKLLLTQTKAVD